MLNWLVGRAGGSVYWVNLICASILVWGTVVFCRTQSNPWLALVVAVPYMLVVVGMGYTRQSVALGFALLGLAALSKAQVRRFMLWVALGATFHKSAVLLIPIAALAASRNPIRTAFLAIALAGLLFLLLLSDAYEAMWENYVVAQYQSEGGVRVLMNAVPALLLIIFRRRLVSDLRERKLWLWMAVLALACLPLVNLASTAVDRVALYFIPIQMFVFARLPRLARTTLVRTVLVLGVIGYYSVVLYVWLHYAAHAQFWVPYHIILNPWSSKLKPPL
jgi:hypothetical protein